MTDNKIQFVDLPSRHAPFREGFHKVLDQALDSGSYILGDTLDAFEQAVADYIGVKHVIGVANGTDALVLSMKAAGIGEGDEVITSPMSYLATTSSIALAGATAVFTDIDQSLNLCPKALEEAITDKTKAIMLVHLSGLPAQIQTIREIADRHNLVLIEDCAQSLGAMVDDKKVGSFGDFTGVSFHPLKNLGGIGDGGAIFTNDDDKARWLRQARNHGHAGRDHCDFWSVNSRLDALQAGFLHVQLNRYQEVLAHRWKLADIYFSELGGVVEFPKLWGKSTGSYNWLMILATRREELMSFLLEHQVESKVHYPVLIPDLKAAERNCRTHGSIATARYEVDRILSLPNAEHITEKDVYRVCDLIKLFYKD